jgi:hypothetical protein
LIDRLGKKIISARLDAFDSLLSRIEGRNHNHRQHHRRGIFTNLAADFVTAHLRHHHVKQHQVRPLRVHLSQSLAARYSGHDGISLNGQKIGQQLHVSGSVVNDENFGW